MEREESKLSQGGEEERMEGGKVVYYLFLSDHICSHLSNEHSFSNDLWDIVKRGLLLEVDTNY